MFKHLIKDMKWIETNYLGYLNTSGSDPVKWSMIEWLVLQFAKQLNKEAIKRQMLGYRVEPKEGEKASGMFAATGIIHKLIDFYDKENKVLPFFDKSVCEFTIANIGDVLGAFMAEISDRVDDADEYTVYLNAKFKPMFKAWYTATYGTNADFSGVIFKVPNYDNEIVFVPAMGNLQFIFASKPGNIQLLENVPGEMLKMYFQRDLEAVWAASYWKEGAATTFSGAQKKDKEELAETDAVEQIIFMNWPAVDVTPDAVVLDGKAGMLLKTGVNTKATALTDIKNAKNDVVYRIEIGDATFPTQINKAGKFDTLTAAWAPTKVGEWIKVYCKDGKFYDVDRG